MAEAAEVPGAVHQDTVEQAAGEDPLKKNEEESERRHMRLLQGAFDKTRKKCLSGFSLSLLKKHLPLLYAKNPEWLRSFQKETVQQLEANIQGEMEMIFEEENIKELMNKLDDLIESAEKNSGSEAWRPTGRPLQDVAAHLCAGRRRYLETLGGVLAELESQNKLLQGAVVSQRQQLSRSQAGLSQLCVPWLQAAEVMPAAMRERLEAMVSSVTAACDVDNAASTVSPTASGTPACTDRPASTDHHVSMEMDSAAT